MFRKLFIAYLSILIFIMAVLSFAISSLAQDYVYDEKESALKSAADRANIAAGEYSAGAIDQQALTAIIDAIAYITDTKIYIAKADIYDEIGTGGEFTGQYLKDAVGKAINGESVFEANRYSSDFDAKMLFYARPWQDETEIKGVILLFSPEREIGAIIGDLQLAIWLTAAAFILIGGGVIFIITKRLVRPIKAIESASSRMAAGDIVHDIDITTKDELASLARSFNSMKSKLEKNETLRQQLIANISHDLRTPVTSINGFLSGMEEGLIKPEEYPKYIRILKKETKRLMDLTGGILEAAKIQSGSIELNIRRFALIGAADEAVGANSVFAQNRNVTIVNEVDKKLYVNADRKKIVQVLCNLIDNAVKYSDRSRPGIVSISAVKTESGIEVCVRDNGIGIDEQDLPSIFDRFYRADSGEGGFGLGLCIVKAYVEAHGGRVSINSVRNEGTKVCFVLNP